MSNKKIPLKQTAVVLGAVVALAGATALPAAVANAETGIQLAACNPCAAKKASARSNPCNPCAAKRNPCNPCAAKRNPCNPCAAKRNPCNPCAAKRK